MQEDLEGMHECFCFFFFTLVTGPRRSLSLKLSGTRVYEPQIRARLQMQEDLEGLHECLRDVGTLVHQQGEDLGYEQLSTLEMLTLDMWPVFLLSGSRHADRPVV